VRSEWATRFPTFPLPRMWILRGIAGEAVVVVVAVIVAAVVSCREGEEVFLESCGPAHHSAFVDIPLARAGERMRRFSLTFGIAVRIVAGPGVRGSKKRSTWLWNWPWRTRLMYSPCIINAVGWERCWVDEWGLYRCLYFRPIR